MITGCNAVYYQHFGLDGPPFQFTPALKTLYMGRGYREALAALRWGLLHEPSGFTLFTCETGVGKTTLVHRLLSDKYETVRAALIVNPAIGFGPLLEKAVRQLGIECGSAGAVGQLTAGPGVRSSARRPNSTLHGSDIKPNNLSSPEPASREAGRKSTLTASPRSASTLRHNHAIRARTKSGIEAPPTAHSSKGPTGSPSDGGAAPGNGLPSGVSGGRRGSAGQQGREVAAEPGSLVKKPFFAAS
jgi:hypothetical protein